MGIWERVMVGAGGVLLVAGLLAAFWPSIRRQFIYPGGTLDPTLADPALHGLEGAEEVWLVAEDGVRLHAWWTAARGVDGRDEAGDPPDPGRAAASPDDDDDLPGLPLAGPARGTVLYCHGNAETMATRAWIADWLADRGFHVLLFDYRGYGLSAGRSTEEGTRRDARAAWRHVVDGRGVDPGRVVLIGHSLGSAVAGRLALEVSPGVELEPGDETPDLPPGPPAALVVGSPFLGMPDVFRANARWLPGFALRWNRERLDAGARLGELDVPVLIIAGTDDPLIPAELSRAVYEGATDPKEWVAVTADHGALMGQPEVWQALDRLLAEVAAR